MKRFIYITATIILIASCSKHHDAPIAQPVIGSQTLADSVLTIGQSLKIDPMTANVTTSTTFSWTVNGQAAGTDSTYTFAPTTRGDYQLVFTATNAGGTTSVTYKIH